MRVLFLFALAVSAVASAQSPLTDRTGFQLLVSEFNENGSLGTLARTEELGGLDSPDHHRFGVDVTALRRWSSGFSLGLRGGVYRYDPVGLGGRAGLTLGLATGLTGSTDLRIETEVGYLQGRFDDPETGYEAAAVQADGVLLLQQRLPLPGSLDFRLAAGPYAVLTNTLDAYNVDDPSREGSEFEDAVFHGGVQVGAALTFALLDARLAIAPVTRFALAGETEPAAFSAVPGGGIWVDF
ncbi:MAG: hypothetical protein AAGI52_15210 [Bacteroidota bacterium]